MKTTMWDPKRLVVVEDTIDVFEFDFHLGLVVPEEILGFEDQFWKACLFLIVSFCEKKNEKKVTGFEKIFLERECNLGKF